MSRKIKMGMVGGGKGAFIGAVHRMASRVDGQIELVCGAFSSDPQKSKESGEELFLDPDRVYPSFHEMIQKEQELPEGERMDFVSIVTPNFMHFEPAKLALENGFHVMVDKPITFSTEEALELKKILNDSGKYLGLTHTYTGYPMIKEAAEMIKNGAIGKVRKVMVEYPQGWLAKKLEEESDQKQASWRTDPKKSGKSGCMGDIGTHAENLAEYVTGLKIVEVCANLNVAVEGRRLDDDGNVILKFDNGSFGTLIASQVAAGEENSLSIRIYGEKGGLLWKQEDNNSLWIKSLDKPWQVKRTGANGLGLSDRALLHTRFPVGHPEGYLLAFANIYRDFAFTLQSVIAGRDPDPAYLDFPSIEDGIRGMAFIDAVVESSEKNQQWVKIKH